MKTGGLDVCVRLRACPGDPCIRPDPKHPSTRIQYQSKTEKNSYAFSFVIPAHVKQKEMYQATTGKHIKAFLQGMNCCTVAYGHTGSGKTYTVHGDKTTRGIIPRLLQDVITSVDQATHIIYLKYIELSGTKTFDLFACTPKSKARRRNIDDCESQPVYNYKTAFKMYSKYSSYRATGATAKNHTSSRSHAIFQVIVQNRKSKEATTFTVVDLAGSERIKNAHTRGNRMQEGIKINSSLFNLRKSVRHYLQELKKSQDIPERKLRVIWKGDELTQLIGNSLAIGRVLLIICMNPAPLDMKVNKEVLDFANLACTMKHLISRRPDTPMPGSQVARLKAEVEKLNALLERERKISAHRLERIKEAQMQECVLREQLATSMYEREDKFVAAVENAWQQIDGIYVEQRAKDAVLRAQFEQAMAIQKQKHKIMHTPQREKENVQKEGRLRRKLNHFRNKRKKHGDEDSPTKKRRIEMDDEPVRKEKEKEDGEMSMDETQRGVIFTGVGEEERKACDTTGVLDLSRADDARLSFGADFYRNDGVMKLAPLMNITNTKTNGRKSSSTLRAARLSGAILHSVITNTKSTKV